MPSYNDDVARKHPCGAAPTLLALLTWATLCGSTASAQQAAAPPPDALPPVTVNAPATRTNQAGIAGFGNTPGWQLPMQAQTFSAATLKNNGVQRLSDLTGLDASISDSYNAQGYWDFLSVRGYLLDNTTNYRREGLPINAETSIPLDNKSDVEILKGISGMQAGVSAPGGLVNFLVKRPQSRVRSGTLAFTGGNSVLTAVDLSDRFGAGNAMGLRINAAYEHLDPTAQHAQGKRHLLALATDLRINADSVIEFEIERSRRQQASVPGFSMLGNTMPSAKSVDPDINLNYQPWALPVVMESTTGTLRWKQKINAAWDLTSTYGIQRLYSDDRTVFAFGCGSELPLPLGDRFCSDGTFDAYDYDSEAERRITHALDIALEGQVKAGSTSHALRFEALRSTHRTDVNSAAFNYIGAGDVSGDFGPYPRNPGLSTPQHIRHNQSTELSVSDAVTLSERWHAWLGLRQTQLQRYTVLSDNSLPAVTSEQRFTTPWAALGYSFAPRRQVYASWGEGVESKNAPELSPTFATYTNAGETLPAQKSRQVELGVKGQENEWAWSAGAFRIHKPQAGGINLKSTDPSYVIDGEAVHAGLEGQLQAHSGPWDLSASTMVLHAERQGRADASLNGKKPVNVPDYTVKLSADYKVAALHGLSLQGKVVHEGRRAVTDDNSVSIPRWTRVDAGARYVQSTSGQTALTWRLGISNLFDTRAWREAPKQFDHIYLFPMARRTVTASLQADF